jgi:hypothetical protein
MMSSPAEIFSKKAINFFTNLKSLRNLPGNIKLLNPYKDEEVKIIVNGFYNRFFNDTNQRVFILGINPGRFGGGVTGIAFTDPIALEEYCGIKNSLIKKPELSSKWGETGLLVSDNPQSTSLVDYDLIADQNDNAIIVFTNTRNGGNLNVFAYMISTNGNFIWGTNGVGLSSATDFQANPKVTETIDGNFVFTWIVATDPTRVALQKLSPDW